MYANSLQHPLELMFKDQGDVPFMDIRRKLIFKWIEETNFEGMPCIHITEQQYEQLIPHVDMDNSDEPEDHEGLIEDLMPTRSGRKRKMPHYLKGYN